VLNEAAVPALVSAAANGDKEAARQLYLHFVQRIFNFIFSMVHSREDAEDITQDAFIQALHNLAAIKDPSKFEYWLYRIARNEIYQRYRRKKVDEVPLDDYYWQDLVPLEGRRQIQNPEDEYLQEELDKVVKTALQTLPPRLREVFILSVLHHKSYKDIAKIVGRSLLSVKTDIYRARVFSKDTIKRYLSRK